MARLVTNSNLLQVDEHHKETHEAGFFFKRGTLKLALKDVKNVEGFMQQRAEACKIEISNHENVQMNEIFRTMESQQNCDLLSELSAAHVKLTRVTCLSPNLITLEGTLTLHKDVHIYCQSVAAAEHTDDSIVTGVFVSLNAGLEYSFSIADDKLKIEDEKLVASFDKKQPDDGIPDTVVINAICVQQRGGAAQHDIEITFEKFNISRRLQTSLRKHARLCLDNCKFLPLLTRLEDCLFNTCLRSSIRNYDTFFCQDIAMVSRCTDGSKYDVLIKSFHLPSTYLSIRTKRGVRFDLHQAVYSSESNSHQLAVKSYIGLEVTPGKTTHLHCSLATTKQITLKIESCKNAVIEKLVRYYFPQKAQLLCTNALRKVFPFCKDVHESDLYIALSPLHSKGHRSNNYYCVDAVNHRASLEAARFEHFTILYFGHLLVSKRAGGTMIIRTKHTLASSSLAKPIAKFLKCHKRNLSLRLSEFAIPLQVYPLPRQQLKGRCSIESSAYFIILVLGIQFSHPLVFEAIEQKILGMIVPKEKQLPKNSQHLQATIDLLEKTLTIEIWDLYDPKYETQARRNFSGISRWRQKAMSNFKGPAQHLLGDHLDSSLFPTTVEHKALFRLHLKFVFHTFSGKLLLASMNNELLHGADQPVLKPTSKYQDLLIHFNC